MTEPPNQQTPYPLILALSVALFIHVVLGTLVNAWLSLPTPDNPTPAVSVRIAPSGSSPQPSPVHSNPVPRKTERQARPGEPAESSAPRADANTQGDTERSAEPVAASEGETSEQRLPPETSRQPRTSTPRTAPATTAGTDAPESDTDTNTPVTRLSQNDRRERSDYEIALWERIAREVEYTPLLAELEGPKEVVLNLRLMVNGALRRAQVSTSSGIPELDGVAREAALAATPFPEPPEGRRRFSVRLIFEPARPE
ncbi:energy transducer TonB family protein [Vreelandella utahensis]|uniref:energy transducer TonB family protein n=1 Tax=Vreelandella halophila TaxID=86177 RepID=UPI0009853750|nr:energy transducer TonB [Halomonas utahensis]